MSDDNAEKAQEVRKGLSKEHLFFFLFTILQFSRWKAHAKDSVRTECVHHYKPKNETTC